jgi:hypothetical protein
VLQSCAILQHARQKQRPHFGIEDWVVFDTSSCLLALRRSNDQQIQQISTINVQPMLRRESIRKAFQFFLLQRTEGS